MSVNCLGHSGFENLAVSTIQYSVDLTILFGKWGGYGKPRPPLLPTFATQGFGGAKGGGYGLKWIIKGYPPACRTTHFSNIFF